MKKIIVLLSCLVLLLSCEQETKFLIEEDKMVDVLVDIHLADGVLNTKSFPYSEEQLRAENYYANILEKHHITRQDFDSALSQYSQHRELYGEMYDKVIEKLRTQESHIQATEEDTKENKGNRNMFSYHFFSDYEKGQTLTPAKSKNISTQYANSGTHSYHVKNEKRSQQYLYLFNHPVQEVKIKFKAKLLFETLPKKFPNVAFELINGNKIAAKYYFEVSRLNPKQGEWVTVDVKTTLLLKNPQNNIRLSACFFNGLFADYYVDDYVLEIKQLK